MASAILIETGIIRVDRYGRPTRGLARSWQTSDRRTWTFTFDEHLRAHNGQPLTADTLKALVARLVVKPFPPYSHALWRELERVDAPTPTTLVLTFRRPTSVLPEALAFYSLWMADPAQPLSSGPYRVSRETDSELEFEAFPDFWEGVPVAKKLHVRFHGSSRAAWTAFLRGEADFLYSVPPAAAMLLARHQDVRLYASGSRFVYTLVFQQRHRVLRDVRVRRALNLAIDREAIGRRLFGTHWRAASSPFSPDYWALEGADTPWPYDVAEARRLLQEALGDRHQPLELTCLTSNEFPQVADVAADVEAQLQRVNVKLRLQALPIEQLLERQARGDFDVFLSNASSGFGGFWPMVSWRSGMPQQLLDAGYIAADAQIDALWTAATPDEERAAVRAVLDVMRRDPPAAFLVSAQSLRAVRRSWRVPEDTTDIRLSLPRWTYEDPACTGS